MVLAKRFGRGRGWGPMGARFFVGAYLTLQMAVALFSLRYWPFTDYPMFAAAYDRFSKIETYRLQGTRNDGAVEWLPRGATRNFGHTDFKMNAIIQKGDIALARQMLIAHLKLSPRRSFERFRKISVVHRVLERGQGEFTGHDQPVFEVLLAEVWPAGGASASGTSVDGMPTGGSQ